MKLLRYGVLYLVHGLLEYCWENKGLLLLYEFMQKGSLENNFLEEILPLNRYLGTEDFNQQLGQLEDWLSYTLQIGKSYTEISRPPIYC
ncbi:hypothetical protein PanWU01x14_277930 [Parasponia andersonii]|uniref:Uncharacterized protein n=1 Tax=Parasponia andersonii TaxID=3476 RepID=A0A2P5B256_PARAD|nr:hypothetical protein PanWU01x14_277930 [Parasponia andersonii]